MKTIRDGDNLIIEDFFRKSIFSDYGPRHFDVKTVSSAPFLDSLQIEMYCEMLPRASVVKQEVYEIHIRPNNSINTYEISIVWKDGPEKKVNVYPLDKRLPVYKTYARFDTTDFRGKEYNRLCVLIDEAKEFWDEHNKGVQGK